MSDNEPNKVIESSAFDKWWAEVQEWRRQRKMMKHAKALTRDDNGDTIKYRGRNRVKNENAFLSILILVIGGFFSFIADIFTFIGGMISFVFSMLFSVLRFAMWPAIIMGILWLGTSSTEDSEDIPMTDSAREFKQGVTGFLDSLREQFKGLHIEIETKDGEKIEFGTKQPEPPEPPEEPSNE